MNKKVFATSQQLILASSSPRRRNFLHNLGLEFIVSTVEVDEIPLFDELPSAFALRMAKEKAHAVSRRHPGAWVVGADTVVTLPEGTILGKPDNEHHALAMLQRLNRITHLVMTGVCLCCLKRRAETVFVETTEVTFTDIPETALRAYIQTGEPMDKAGAYGIQGLGSFLVKSINGSCTNVIGLPVSRLISALLANNIIKPVSDTPGEGSVLTTPLYK